MTPRDLQELGGIGLLIAMLGALGKEWQVSAGSVAVALICFGLSFAVRRSK
jgi:hypothetical protein